MDSNPRLQADRFERFCADVLEPAVYPRCHPLAVEAFQSTDPISPAQAAQGPFRNVTTGWEWGPAWTTTWFRLRGTVPTAFRGRALALRFDTGVEAQLWRNLEPVQGFDVNRDSAILAEVADGGEPIELLVEAACNHPFGIETFAWDHPDTHRRWRGDRPARLERAELAVYDPLAWELAVAYRFAALLLRELPPESPRAQQLIATLRRATRLVDDRGVAASAQSALAELSAGLAAPAPGSATICHAVGHAHLDTAWLWPLRETRRKCVRSFSNVLALMERFPDFRFLCSQAAQYAMVEADSPALFERIAQRVREGRWEPAGAMWVEPDANCPSGESLVRQILHGVRYWESRFGDAAPQRILYLPDTFGFPASLPQIMAAAGLDTFITNKLSWNPENQYPHTSFRWRGIDGAEVNAHLTPGADYNAVNTPKELRRGETRHASKHLPGAEPTARWLQPFGYGDGGGGPTDRSIRYAQLAAECDGLPRVTLGRVDDFCHALQHDFDAMRERGEHPPVWDGELYLDLHRGTLTTQAWIKAANRRAEELLRLAEIVSVSEPQRPLPLDAAPHVREALDQAWKLLLLNQFHDILPGSSIPRVYDDARRDHQRLRELAEPLVRAGLDRWARALGGPIVVNPAGAERDGVVETASGLRFARAVPAIGARRLSAGSPPADQVSVVDGRNLTNGILRVEVGDDGAISSLHHAPTGRDACAAAPINQLALYRDRTRAFDAWEIEPEAESERLDAVGAPSSISVVTEHPLRCEIRVERPLGERSRIAQTYRLDAAARRVDVLSEVDWHEDARLLRALFPVDVLAPAATYEIQFGALQRPTHRNTPWDRAKFEVCAHRWMDLSEPGFGVAILNDSKYGHSCLRNLMGITLLRAPRWPDPTADRGRHAFRYAVMPHAGDWRGAGVAAEAEALNTPLFLHDCAPARPGDDRWAPLAIRCDSPARASIEALKPAEDGDGLILRLVETHGARGSVHIDWPESIRSVHRVDLLERPLQAAPAAIPPREPIPLRPFEILTLRARTAR